MSFLCIIPARYASVRFPGKPLALLGNKPVIQWVYERSFPVIEETYVATDDKRIYDEVLNFGGKAVMTSCTHLSGTDRCAEALHIISNESGKHFQYVINIQGDEPFIHDSQIHMLMKSFQDERTDIATLARKIHKKDDIFNVNITKVVTDSFDYALYFSRSPIPYIRNLDSDLWPGEHSFYHHIGVYAYKAPVLFELSRLSPSPLERAESLEQLRWLQNGYKIKVNVTEYENIGIDTPEDLKKAEKYLHH